MSYARKAVLTAFNGAALTDKSLGVLGNIIHIEYSYMKRGGCERAEVRLAREFGDFSIASGYGNIANGQQLCIYWDTSTVVWRGYVDSLDFDYDGGPLVLRAIGYGAQALKQHYPVQVYGPGATTTEFTGCHPEIDDIGGIVKDLWDVYLAGGAMTMSTIEGTDTTIRLLQYDGQRNISEILDDLAIMAGGFTWGVDEDLKFFFKDIPQTLTVYDVDDANIDTFRLTKTIEETYNKLIIQGGDRGDSKPFIDTFDQATSQLTYGVRTAIRSLPEMSTSTDAQTYASNFFAVFGEEHTVSEFVLNGLDTWTSIPKPSEELYYVRGRSGLVLGSMTIYTTRTWPSDTSTSDWTGGASAERVQVTLDESPMAAVSVGPVLNDPEMQFLKIIRQEQEKEFRRWLSIRTRDASSTEAGDEKQDQYTYQFYPVRITGIEAGPTYNCKTIDSSTLFSAVPNLGESSLAANDYAILFEQYLNGALQTTSIIESGNVWK